MAYDAEKVVPYSASTENKGAQVEQMFDSIAVNYDKLNHTLSMGIDKAWRRKGLSVLKKYEPKTILDIATGTGDLALLAFDMLGPDKILGIDISEKMMDVGRAKVRSLGLDKTITFQKQDCLSLSVSDASFDVAIVAFGVRNFENLDLGLQEILRVLKPGGALMILELSTPEHFPMKQLYQCYSKLFIPLVGKIISKDKVAYSYLPKSVEAFVQGKKMVEVLLQNGFTSARCTKYTFGICSMYLAEK